MLKRILSICSGVALGTVLAMGFSRLALTRGWWPAGELDRNAAYYRDVMALVHDQYVDGTAAAYPELTRSALEGMLQSLDPHSEFLVARDYRQLEEDIDGKFGGIGVQVESRQGRVVVVAPIAGTPGDRAGIRRGDQIVAVDGESVERLGMDEVISRLRGRPGTSVKVGLLRPSTEETLDVSITREAIRVESVRDVRVLGGGVGYVQLTQFSDNTGSEFREALSRLRKDGAEALVLDLRNNPGGVLDAAVDVAEPFFDRGDLVVYTQGRDPSDREEHRAGRAGDWRGVPVAVLVNSGSASAAEIVAGALKDSHRAVIVGERTFGKGSVQSIFRLRDGEGLRLTTARYFTPGGVTIHERGITPDIEIELTAEDERKLRVQRARTDFESAAEFAERFGFEPIEDRQLQAAIDVLRGVQLFAARGEAAGAEDAGRGRQVAELRTP